MKAEDKIPSPASPSNHEASGLEPAVILKTVTIILATLLMLVLAGLLLFRGFAREYPHRTSEAAPLEASSDLPPEPRLQTQPLLDLQTVRAREDEHIDRYAWVDRTRGIAQIPIERAMALWVANDQAPPVDTASTNAAPVPVTELMMRQQKAEEADHAP
ncbi:MAG TPA: hypothetical protein VL981_04030 [Candidatus Methylacidiphilales bacterium]|nr:hypothetical protein [Candidatus Methylacidiphilales bacterium]